MLYLNADILLPIFETHKSRELNNRLKIKGFSRVFSSAGSERLPYKQEVRGSIP